MLSKIFSGALQGLNAQLIEVETSAVSGLKSFAIVGLADTAIKEAKERVGSAIKSLNLKPPQTQAQRIVVNLAPADIKKEGSLYDLPIAIAYLLASEQIQANPNQTIFVGELALDGTLKPVRGALSLALMAKNLGFKQIVLPKTNSQEASLANFQNNEAKLQIIGAENLKQVISFLEKRIDIAPTATPEINNQNLANNFEIDFAWIRGQSFAKRGLEIAAAGSHHLFLLGPPGAGKTLLAKSLVSILPDLSPQEMIELTQIYSTAGLLRNSACLWQRPFRSPHHSASAASIVGGGSPPRFGEITLAHRGILFTDEFPEFHRDVLESLRQPMEEGKITVLRAKANLEFPAKFSLVASANPCPCGFHGDQEKECKCSHGQVASYQRKLRGPLIDRFDIFCWVPAVKYEDIIDPIRDEISNTNKAREETSQEVKARIQLARAIQQERFKNEDIFTNSEMNIPLIKKHCQIDAASALMLKEMMDTRQITARGFHRILKTSRTIADLAQSNDILAEHIREASAYRFREEI